MYHVHILLLKDIIAFVEHKSQLTVCGKSDSLGNRKSMQLGILSLE